MEGSPDKGCRPLCLPGLHSPSRRDFCGSIALAFAALLAVSVAGCGGGTRGTGDELKSLVIGTVVDTKGVPLVGATVTQLETGDSTATNGDGAFALEVAVEGGSAQLLIERAGFEGTAVLTGLEGGTQADPEEFTITVDLVTGIVTAVTVNGSRPRPTPQPTTGPTPEPTATPDDGAKVREHSIRGEVVNQAGFPVSNVRLTVAGSGSAVSGGNGRFSLLVRTTSSRIRVTVRFGQNRGSFVIGGLPTGRDAEIDITVRITQSSAPQFHDGEIPDPAFSVALSDISIR